jgi:O-antigen/teichoic acid export membrane protein
LAFAANVEVARMLGASRYGTYATALTLATTLSILVLLGQSNAVLRYIPRYVHASKWAELRGLRLGVFAMVSAAALAVAVMGMVATFVLGAHTPYQQRISLLAGFALIVPLAWVQLSGALHRALRRPASSGAFYSLLRPTLLVAIVLAYPRLLHKPLTSVIAVLANFAAALVSFAGSELLLNAHWPREAKGLAPRFELAGWFSLGRQLVLMAVIEIMLGRADVLILAAFTNALQVGPYFAAVQLATIAAYGLTATNTIVAPMIASHYAANDIESLHNLVRRAAFVTLGITLVVVVPMAVFGRQILAQFGNGFSVAYVPLLIVLAGQCANALTGPVGYLMTMTRFERHAPLIFGSAAALNIALNLLLAPRLGMLGSAIAQATSTIAWNVGALGYVRTRLGVNPTVLAILDP